MRKQLLLISAIAIIVIGGTVTLKNTMKPDADRSDYENFIIRNGKEILQKTTSGEMKNPGADRPDEAAFTEFVKTVDPELSRVPAERRIKALEEAEELNRMKSGRQGLKWKEHTVNMGGRTRTIMFDPNDQTGMGLYAGAVTGGLWYNPNPLEDHAWTPVNDYWPNLAVSCMTYDPQNTQTMYIGTGESETALIIYRESSTRGTGIMRSTDGGKEWETIPSTKDWAYVTDIQIRVEEGVSVIYAGVVSGIYHGVHHSLPSDGLYRSVDGGESWTQVLPLVPGSDTPYAPSDISVSSDQGRLFVGTTYGINEGGTDLDRRGASCLLYSDDGINWNVDRTYNEAILNNEFSKYPGRVMVANSESDSNITYAIIASGYPDGAFLRYQCEFMLKSTDKGENWEEINFPQGFASLPWHAFAIEVNPEDPDIIWLGGLDVWRTMDGGENWQRLTNWAEPLNSGTGRYVHADIHVFLHKPGNPRHLFVATDGGVFFTGSSLAPDRPVFHEMNIGYNTLQFYTGDINPEPGLDYFLGGLQDNGTLMYHPQYVPDRGTKLSGGDGAFCFFDDDEPNLVISTVYYTSMYYWSVDQGYINGFYGNYRTGAGTFINPMDYNWKDNTIYCNVCGFDGQFPNTLGLLGFDEDEFTGEPLELQTNCPVPYSAIKWDENSTDDYNTVYIGTASGRLFRLYSVDSPETLTEITGENFPVGNINSIDIGQTGDTLLVTFTNYGIPSVWLSTDAGENWTNIESNLPDMPVRWGIFHPDDNSIVMLATEAGIWTTPNALAEDVVWSPDIDGLANVRVDMLKLRESDNTVLAVTHGRGMFSTEWDISGSSSNEDIRITKNLELYPNPTDGEFTIELELQSKASLKIHDMQGRLVRSDELRMGNNLRNYNLSHEPKGVYLVSIEGRSDNYTGRILLK